MSRVYPPFRPSTFRYFNLDTVDPRFHNDDECPIADVIIMQGTSGSGKSKLANELVKGVDSSVVCSADQYFEKPDSPAGFEFDKTKIGAAHSYSMRKFLDALNNDVDLIVVDNCNTKLYEMAPYVRAAQAFDREILVVRTECPIKEAQDRAIHCVHPGVIESRAFAMEDPRAFHVAYRVVWTGEGEPIYNVRN